MKPQVLIVMGSDSDLPVMGEAGKILKEFGIPYKMTVASAHRTPERIMKLASYAEENGVDVIIAGAGMAAHLAGALASHTLIPVIGVPIDSSPLRGLDALLSTVQVPSGVPVATVAIGKAGAKNAAILSVQIMSKKDPTLIKKLKNYRKKIAQEIEEKAKSLK